MKDNLLKEVRKEGESVLFEYHCCESYDSADVELWYRSHSRVTVLDCDNSDDFGNMTFIERVENGCPLIYHIRFKDGHIGAAFEDELLDSEKDYCRTNPPIRRST